MKIKYLTQIILGMCMSAAAAADIDMESGKELTMENCTACHGSEVYTRKDRFVTSKKKLVTQVQRCEQSQGLLWLDEEVNNVSEYLNKELYHFK